MALQVPKTSNDVPPPLSPSLAALAALSRALATTTLDRLIQGYQNKSGSGYGPATSNAAGCLLCQKGTNRADNAYVQIAPISSASRGAAGEKRAKPLPQNAHRLVVIAHHSEEDVSAFWEVPRPAIAATSRHASTPTILWSNPSQQTRRASAAEGRIRLSKRWWMVANSRSHRLVAASVRGGELHLHD
ncbi:hypothetical protein GQ44DRAFT_833247 [Phaeosphaeriaceae sp. PMI808]|nr:hypothetical protein GQ44DRAFT_833247 [Phaeosphaeriaceae sp. PMI808]